MAEPERGGALLPRDLLLPGEQVELLIRPSLWYVLLSAWRGYLGIGVATALGWWLVPAYAWIGPIAAAVLLAGRWLVWASLRYLVTNQRIIGIGGVVQVTTVALPRERVQHTRVTRSPGEQVLGLGTVRFATAGTGGEEMAWVNVNDAYAVQQAAQGNERSG